MSIYTRYCNAYNAIVSGNLIEPVDGDEHAAAAMLGACHAREDQATNSYKPRSRDTVTEQFKALLAG